MVSSKESSAGLVYNIRLSSVGPGRVTGQDVVYEPNGIDLAMKLHYIRLVYYFNSQAFEGIGIKNIKEPMFNWLNQYYTVCGRFRRSSTGRPYIKCNDCGVRFVEAQCHKSLDEWLLFINGGHDDDDNDSVEKLLVSDNIIGPELDFSPLAFFQVREIIFGINFIDIKSSSLLHGMLYLLYPFI